MKKQNNQTFNLKTKFMNTFLVIFKNKTLLLKFLIPITMSSNKQLDFTRREGVLIYIVMLFPSNILKVEEIFNPLVQHQPYLIYSLVEKLNMYQEMLCLQLLTKKGKKVKNLCQTFLNFIILKTHQYKDVDKFGII